MHDIGTNKKMWLIGRSLKSQRQTLMMLAAHVGSSIGVEALLSGKKNAANADGRNWLRNLQTINAIQEVAILSFSIHHFLFPFLTIRLHVFALSAFEYVFESVVNPIMQPAFVK